MLDVQLPGLSGLDLQQSLATAGKSLPIVFITGAGDPAARVQALANGAAGFLLKPIDGVALLDAVSRATTQGQAPDRGAGPQAGWPGSPPSPPARSTVRIASATDATPSLPAPAPGAP